MYERLLDNANIALIHQAAKRYKLSNWYFEYIADLAEDVEPITIQESAGALITNEENFYYRLEDYERILIHFFIALNYLALQQPNEAIVEFRRAEELLNRLSNLRKTKMRFVSAFRFLAAFCYYLRGDIQDAKIELNKINALNLFTQFKNPERILLIVATDLAPKKIPDPSFPFFPKYIDSSYEYSNYRVKLSDSEIEPLFTINIGNLLKAGLKKRLNSIRAKTLAKIALKGASSIVISKKNDWLGILSSLALFSWEKPDLRSIDLLPDKINIFYITRKIPSNSPYNLQVIADKKYEKNKILYEDTIFTNLKKPQFIVVRLPF